MSRRGGRSSWQTGPGLFSPTKGGCLLVAPPCVHSESVNDSFRNPSPIGICSLPLPSSPPYRATHCRLICLGRDEDSRQDRWIIHHLKKPQGRAVRFSRPLFPALDCLIGHIQERGESGLGHSISFPQFHQPLAFKRFGIGRSGYKSCRQLASRTQNPQSLFKAGDQTLTGAFSFRFLLHREIPSLSLLSRPIS